MNTNSHCYVKLFVIASLSCVHFGFAQMAINFSVQNIAPAAQNIVIGRIQKDSTLIHNDPGTVHKVEDLKGSLYEIKVLHVLKGDSSITDMKIVLSEEERACTEMLPIIFYEGKEYLLCLNPRKAPPSLTEFFELPDSSYYFPVYGGAGAEDINQAEGMETLRAMEGYLNIAPFPWRMKTFADWTAILKAKIHSGYHDGQIGGMEFVDQLDELLTSANTKLDARDSIACASDLRRFDNMLNAEFMGFDRLRHLSIDFSSLLESDASYLRYQLPGAHSYGLYPYIESLNPATVFAGGGEFTLALTGEEFESGATVYWNWSPRPTTYISSTELRAKITSDDIAKPDTATVAIFNPNGGAHGGNVIILPRPSGMHIKLISSTGAALTTGALQYYEGGWKSAQNNNDGTFTIATEAKSLSLKMTYEYGIQQKSNVPVGSDTIVFQTTKVQVQLQNSQGEFIDTGLVQYYAGAWRSLGATVNGVASKELLPGNYSFRMTYANGSKDKQQDIGANRAVVFQTVKAAVELKNSQGTPIDRGTVQYYAGAWRAFGETINGTATKELLSNNYTFRMTHEFLSLDKAHDLSANSAASFSTVLCTIRVKDSQNQPVNNAQVSYYAGAWRQIGTTVNGEVSKEMLPVNVTFRINANGRQQDTTQNLSTNNVVEFTTQP